MKFKQVVIVVFATAIGFGSLLEARNINHAGDTQTKGAQLLANYNAKQKDKSPKSVPRSSLIPIIQAVLNPEEEIIKDEIENVTTAGVSIDTSNDEQRTVLVLQVKKYGSKADTTRKKYDWICGKSCKSTKQWKRYSIPYQVASGAVKNYPADECPRFLDKASDDYSDWTVKLYSDPQSFTNSATGKLQMSYDTEHVFEGQTIGVFLEFLMENTFPGMEESIRDPNEPLDWTLGWQEPEGIAADEKFREKKKIWNLDLLKAWFYTAPFKLGTPLAEPGVIGPHTNQSYLEPVQEMINSLASNYNVRGFTIFERYANIMKGKLFGGMSPYSLPDSRGSATAWSLTYEPKTKLSKIQEVGFTFDYMNKYRDKFGMVANHIHNMYKKYDEDWEPFISTIAKNLPVGTVPTPKYDPRNSLSAKWKRYVVYTLQSIEVRCQKWMDAAAVEILNSKDLHGSSAKYGDQLEEITKEMQKMFTLEYKPSPNSHIVASASLKPAYRNKLKLDAVIRNLSN